MPFLADAMLGKLARWLRILGFDTLYEPGLSDQEIIDTVKAGGRVLLTKDSRLHSRTSRQDARSVLIRGTEIVGMLQEISPLLSGTLPGTRCPACNSLLVEEYHPAAPNSGGQAALRWRCASCGKLYWHGAHWKGIRRTLVLAGLGDRVGDS